MTPQEFYSQYLPYAEKVSNQTGLDPRLVLAQAALETGYGKSAPNMNFFGIKSHGRKNGQTLQTSEFEDGQMVNRPASFRGYESPDQSFQDYASFLKSNPRYEGVLSARGLENQISAMAKSGYATDPNYGAKLANIAGKFDPNSPPIIASDTMRVLGKQPKGLLAVPEETNDTESKMIPEEKPKGLLGSLGIQKMVEGAEGEAGQRFFQRDTFKDTAARMAPLLAAMGSSPALQKATAGIAAQRTEKNARNKSMEYLAGLPNGEEFVRIAEVAGPKAAMQAYLESRKAPKDTSTSAMKNYDKYQRILAEKGPEAAKQFLSTIKSGTTINTGDVGQGNFIYGSKAGLPAGYRLDKRTGEASVIPGGPAEQEIAEQQIKSDKQQGGGSIMGQNVLQTAKRVRELIGPYSVGYGSLLSSLPETDARELKREVDALGAIASSENLNAMREASPTGGALGNVSDKDIKLLKDKSGAIDTGSKPDQFRKQVDEYELFLLQTIHGPEAGLKIFNETRDVVPQPYPNTASTSKTKTGVSFTIIDEGKN